LNCTTTPQPGYGGRCRTHSDRELHWVWC